MKITKDSESLGLRINQINNSNHDLVNIVSLKKKIN